MVRFVCLAILALWPCLAVAQDSPAQSEGKQEQAKSAELKTAWAEARELLAKAKRVRDPNELPAALQTAVKQYEACLTLKFSDDGEKHRVIREVATAHLELAKIYWPEESWNGPGDERQRGPYRPQAAREHYARAHELFTQAADYWRGKVGELPTDREEAQKKIIAAGLGFIELGAAESDAAHCLAGIARALPADDAKKKEAVQATVDAYKRVWKGYPTIALGQYAGLAAARMLAHADEHAAAMEINAEVLNTLGTGLQARQSYVDDLYGRVTWQSMLCWNNPKMDQPETAIEVGNIWIESATSADGREVTWEPQIRSQLAKAYYLRWVRAAADKRDDADRRRALEEATWVADRYRGDVTAQLVLRGLEPGARGIAQGEQLSQIAAEHAKLRRTILEFHPDVRDEVLSEAAEDFDDCLKLKLASEDERQRVVRAAATARYELAKAYWPPDLWDRSKATPQYRDGFAEEQYERASKLFAEAAAYWSAKLGEQPKDRDQAIKKILAQHAEYAELLAAEGDGAACLRGIACVQWANDARDAKDAVKKAVEASRRVWDIYAITPVGAHSGLRGAEVLLVSGDAKGALELTETVLESVDKVYSIKPETIDEVRFSAERLRMMCWSDAKFGKQDEAIKFGEEWLTKQADDAPAAKIRAVEMRAQVAFAYYMRWKSAATDERDDKDRQTAWDHAVWVERQRQKNETARRVLREIDLEMLKERK